MSTTPAMTPKEALDVLRTNDLLGLGMEADTVRRRLHPENVVSYLRQVRLDLGSFTTAAQLEQAVCAVSDTGATSLYLTAENVPLDNVLAHVRRLSETFTSPWLHGFSAAFVMAHARQESVSPEAVLTKMQEAGLRSLAGNDAGRVDHGSGAEDWLSVHRTAHRLGLPTSAARKFGGETTLEQSIAWLDRVRALQQDTNGFFALLPLPHTAAPEAAYAHSEEPTAIELLKMIAVCRLFVGNIPHIESSWSTAGGKVLQMALRFGADDVGSVITSGADHEEDVRRIVREAGFRPAERNAGYTWLALA